MNLAWERLRTGLWAVLLGGSTWSFAKVLWPPIVLPKPSPTYLFPQSIQIPGWQLLASQPIPVQQGYGPGFVSSVDAQSVAARRYQYRRQGRTIAIEMRFFENTYVESERILEESTLKPQKLTVQVRPLPPIAGKETGAYALSAQPQTLHLSACLTAHGLATATDRQIRVSQNHPEVLLRRSLPWLLGQAPLRDLRCLWGKLSLDRTTAAADIQVLEQSWLEWMQAWQGHYPPESRPERH